MSGFTEHRESNAGEDLERHTAAFNLGTARRMLPLLRRIVGDLVTHQQMIAQLTLEQDGLDRQKRALDWPRRQRRYQVHEDLAAAQRHLEDALAELEVLGVVRIDSAIGLVGLPTVVNGRLAYFSWRPEDSSILYWHYPGEKVRRPIPAGWNEHGVVQLKAHA
jgi:hypothetical protein